jgi:hypothetical protein
LGEFMKLCRQFEVLIRVIGRTIPDALAECSRRMQESWTGDLAASLSERYGAKKSSSGIWAASLRDIAAQSEEAAALNPEDCRAISLFGDQLASSDQRAINEGFALLYKRLDSQMQAADRDRAVKGRLYGSIGLLAGLAAAIVVL